MKKIVTIVRSFGLAGLFVAAMACGKGGGMVSDAEEMVNEMCACKDAACLEKVEKKGEELKKKYSKDDAPSEADQKKLMELGKKAMECEAKIKGEAGGEAAPQ